MPNAFACMVSWNDWRDMLKAYWSIPIMMLAWGIVTTGRLSTNSIQLVPEGWSVDWQTDVTVKTASDGLHEPFKQTFDNTTERKASSINPSDASKLLVIMEQYVSGKQTLNSC